MTRDDPRHDRTGQPVDDQPEQDLPPCICDGSFPGFRGYDSDNPEPCPRHKPHLAPARRQARTWGGNPDARPRPDQSGIETSPTTRENQ